MLGVCVCVWYKCACALLLEAQVDLPYAQIWSLRLPTHHAGEDSNSRHISCEDLEAASLTIMDSAKVRRQEQDKNVQFPQIQAATVLAKAGQLAFAPATVRSDTARPVAVGPVGEHLHNRLQVSSKTSDTILARVALHISAVVSNCASQCIRLRVEAAAAAPAEQTTVSLSAQAQRLACLATWWSTAAKSNN